jgi:hypothetical protein
MVQCMIVAASGMECRWIEFRHITNYLTTINFMYAVCGLNDTSQCKRDLKM